MTSELKPCPFCGGEVEATTRGSEDQLVVFKCEESSPCIGSGMMQFAKAETLETAIAIWNTRAVPDVPELVRYEPDYCVDFRSITTAYMNSHACGRYVLYSQAAEIIAAKDAEINKLNVYNGSYHNQIIELRELLQAAEATLAQYEAQEPVAVVELRVLNGRRAKHIYPINLDNVEAGTTLYTSPAPAADLKAENERLREALKFYADVHKYPSPLTGGMGDLWSDCGRIARAALNLSEPQT